MVTVVVMILRVWAMYNRSRLIIRVLLVLFSATIIATFISVVVNMIPNNLPGT